MPYRVVLCFLVAAVAASCTRSPAARTVPAVQDTALGPAASACALDFDSTYTLVTRDYAGHGDRLRESQSRIAALTDTVRAVVRTAASDSACTAALQRWIALFAEHDHHLQLWQPRPRPTQVVATPPDTAGKPTEDPRRPTMRFLDDSTTVLTFPDFNQRYKRAIDSLVDANLPQLLARPFLVVDVRRNGGGWTGSYARVTPLLYTDPIRRDGMDAWVSEGNIAAVRAMLDDPNVVTEVKAQIREILPRMEANRGTFLRIGAEGDTRFDSVHALPRAVAVLTGRGCVSSCEQFVLDAMQSRKVTVFGTENTAGFLDYGNIRMVNLPSGVRRLALPTARSRRLPARPLDRTGITPNILIPKDESDPIAFAVRYIKSATR